MNTRRKNQPGIRPAVQDPIIDGEELRRRTTAKAYELYLRRQRAPGHDIDDWLEAERLVRQEFGPASQRARRGPRTESAA